MAKPHVHTMQPTTKPEPNPIRKLTIVPFSIRRLTGAFAKSTAAVSVKAAEAINAAFETAELELHRDNGYRQPRDSD